MTDFILNKKAKCPKCDRFCTVAQFEEEEWKEAGMAKKLSDNMYQVECPGCGVLFNADISAPVPCWEEKVEQYSADF